MMGQTTRSPSATTLLYCLCGALVLFALGFAFRASLGGNNDFLMLYAGGRLVGTPDLYNPDRVAAVQQGASGFTAKDLLYTRLPYWAWIWRPLCQLPYQTAYVVWQLFNLAAVAGFVALWRPPALVRTLFSFPLLTCFLRGQDVAFLLLWLALAAHFERKGKTGLVSFFLALCFAKYHLFTLLPLLIARQKRWRLGAGIAAWGLVLLGLSFATGGTGWVGQYLHVLKNSHIHPNVNHMPNLAGLFFGWPGATFAQIIVGASVVYAVWVIVGWSRFEVALAAVVAGGLLLSFRCYVYDCALLLPAALTVRAAAESKWVQTLAVVLLLPPIYILSLAPPPLPALAPVSVLLFVYATAAEARRSTLVLPEPIPAEALG